MENIIEIKNITKSYYVGKVPTKALDNVSLNIKKGEILVILGASGGGKTTLLNLVSGLDKIDKNKNSKILYENKDISKYSDSKMTKFRKRNLGFIFQTYNLLEHLNVYENVLVGSSLGRKKVDVHSIIETVGLKQHEKKYMHQLSGGEQQRVSIARALAKKPKVMFCDEPTGALDEKTGKVVLQSLVEANNKYDTTLIIVTHNPGIALIGDKIIKMNSGKIVDEIINEKRTDPKDIPWG
ncbi:MAG: ABC transporter ATP-binding protein [Bacilli bacterium]|nr:ABC transporter ATP-binding protein [Bacilli bacterium]